MPDPNPALDAMPGASDDGQPGGDPPATTHAADGALPKAEAPSEDDEGAADGEVKANAEGEPAPMTGKRPKRYGTATGSDRCDTCFFRAGDGRSCTKHLFDVAMGYVPSGRCEDYQPRSTASWFGQKLEGVEVFKAGIWNGDRFTAKDLDLLVDAFARVGYRPPVTLGHGADPDAPAYGWVTNLRRDGDVLVADFEDVPDDLVEQIKDGRYDAVSAELFLNLKRNGETFPKALRAVAILGAHPPAVSDLKPLRSVLAYAEGTETRSIVVTHRGDTGDMTKPNAAPATDPGADPTAALAQARAQIAALTQQVQALRQAGSDDAALQIQRLTEQNEAMARQFAEIREERRRERIQGVVGRLKLPALRPHLQALAELATAGDGESRTVLFQAKGEDKARETSGLKVIEDLIARLNERSEYLFHEGFKPGQTALRPGSAAAGPVGEDPGAELYGQATRMAREKGLSFAEAQERVMADPENRELVERYNAGVT